MMRRLWTHLAGTGRHPDETALLIAVFDPGDAGGAEVRRHLDACPQCRAVAARALVVQAEARTQAERDADAVFTDAVLERQRAHVRRRLEQRGHPARVLPFPLTGRAVAGAGQTVQRWVAAAAAAGLIVGAVAGRLVTLRQETLPPATDANVAYAQNPRPDAPDGLAPTPAPPNDEAFLVELEVAAASPRIEPLRAIDALTPRINDFRRDPP